MDIISLLVAIPVVTAAALFAIPAAQEKTIKWVATGASFLTFGIAIYLFFVALSGGEAALAKLTPARVDWVTSLGITWSVGVDGISVVMCLLTAIVYITGALVSSHGIGRSVKEYFILLTALVSGVFGVFVIRDLFFMYFAYELAVVPMYLLIGMWGSGDKEYAAMKLTLYLTAGALVALIGILLLYFEAKDVNGFLSFHIDDIFEARRLALAGEAGSHFGLAFQKTTFALLFVGFASIVPMWPMHTWSPIGHAAAPSAGSMMHAGVLMKLGGYAIVRLALPSCPDGAAFWLPYVAVLAMMNIVYGGLVAMAQRDMKFVVGFSSSSHMGYTLLGIASANLIGISGAVFLMFAHGVMTALAFSLIGFFYDQTHNRWIPDLGGLAHQLPFIGTCFVLMSMASAGVPGFANFASEFMVIFGAWEAGYIPQAVIAVFGVVIAAVYLLRAVRDAFFGPRNPRWDGLKDAKGLTRAPYLLLLFVLLFFGFYPRQITDVIAKGVEPTAELLKSAQERATYLTEAGDAAGTQEER